MTKAFSQAEMKSMESWRGFLAIIVCIAHIFQINMFPYIGETGTLQGIIGTIANLSVVVFFVLSGMLISYSANNLTRDGEFLWKQYLVNRVTRIFPTYIAILAICICYIIINYLVNSGTGIFKLGAESYIARDSYSASISDFIFSLLMIHPGISQINGPLWSLFIEWWLYISFMLFFLALKTKKHRVVLLFASIIPLVVPFYFYGQRTFVYTSIWVMGAIYTLSLRHHPKLMSILRALNCVILVVYIIVFGSKSLDIVQTNWKVFAFLQMILAFFSIGIVRQAYLGLFLEFSGRCSYTLYVFHFPTVLLLFSLMHHFYYSNFTLAILFSFLYLLFVFIISHYFAKVLENKYLFRNLFSK